MIPKKIHFVYGLDDDYGNMPFAFFHWAAIKSAKKLNPDYEVYYWYKNLPQSKYIDDLKDDVIFKKLDDVPTHIFGNELCCVAHKADVVRLNVLREHGGIYLDIDTITVKPFDDLLDNKFLMGRECIPGIVDGLCNAVIFSEPNSAFIEKWYDSYRTFRSRGQDPTLPNDYYVEHSVWMPLWIANDNPDLITIVPMDYFFSPDWREESLERFLRGNDPYPNAYVHHLWESKSYNYLKNLDEFSYTYAHSTYSRLLTDILGEEAARLRQLNPMRYTFVDIGCSYFDTSVDTFGLEVNGLLVEPIKTSYDLLPTSSTVKKACVAISDSEGKCTMNVPKLPGNTRYMTKQEVVALRETDPPRYESIVNCGGASLYDDHYWLQQKNVGTEPIECDMITFHTLCEQYDIQEVDFLNIDTEGHDHIILKQIVQRIEAGNLKIHNSITFEFNELSNKPELKIICEQLETLGFRTAYVTDRLWNDDIVATKLGIDVIADRAYFDRKSRVNMVKQLYLGVLGREADEGGLQHYVDSGKSFNEIRDILSSSEEYLTKNA